MINKFKSKTKIPFIVSAIQYNKHNKEEVVQFFKDIEYYEVKDQVTGSSYLHFRKDEEGWIRVGEYDFAIRYEDTGEYYAFSPDVFFKYYKTIR